MAGSKPFWEFGVSHLSGLRVNGNPREHTSASTEEPAACVFGRWSLTTAPRKFISVWLYQAAIFLYVAQEQSLVQ